MTRVYFPKPRKPEPLELDKIEVGQTRFFGYLEASYHRIMGYANYLSGTRNMRFKIERALDPNPDGGGPIAGHNVTRLL